LHTDEEVKKGKEGRWYSTARVSKRLTDETAAQPLARGAVPTLHDLI
jgi:hypothetical protein